MKRVLKCLGGSILPLLAAVGIQLVVGIVVGVIYSFVLSFQIGMKISGSGEMLDTVDLASQIQSAASQDVIYLITALGILISGVVFFFWYRREFRGLVRGRIMDTVLKPKNLIYLVILGFGCQSLISGGMSLIKPFLEKLFSDYAKVMETLTGGNEVIVFLLIVLVAPIAEELIFRGVILHKTNKVIPFVGANILQALLFGIYHGNIVQGIYAFILGLLFGMVHHRFNTIVAPIALHMIVNASAFIVGFVPEATLSYILLTVVGLAAILISLRALEVQYLSKDMVPINQKKPMIDKNE